MALFTPADARTFLYNGSRALEDTGQFTDTDITETAARTKQKFEDYCNVAFEPTVIANEKLDGASYQLWLKHAPIISVQAISLNGGAVTDLTDLVINNDEGVIYRPGGFNITYWGYYNTGTTPTYVPGSVLVSYTHGYATVPLDIKRAALITAVLELQGRAVPVGSRWAEMAGTPVPQTYQGAYKPYGPDDIDNVLNFYRRDVIR